MILGSGCATHDPIRSGKKCTTVQWQKDAKSLYLFGERVGEIGAVLEWPTPRNFDIAINLPSEGIGSVKSIKLVRWENDPVIVGCEKKGTQKYQICIVTSPHLQNSESAIMFYSDGSAEQAKYEIMKVKEYFENYVLGCVE